MIDKPIMWRVTEKDHAMFLMPIEVANPSVTILHPCFAFPNEDGYIKNEKVAWHKDLAQGFVDLYNREVLKLTPGQVDCIVTSSMFPGVRYPYNYERPDSIGKKIDEMGWKSERPADPRDV